jgi:hypothetical protein
MAYIRQMNPGQFFVFLVRRVEAGIAFEPSCIWVADVEKVCTMPPPTKSKKRTAHQSTKVFSLVSMALRINLNPHSQTKNSSPMEELQQ